MTFEGRSEGDVVQAAAADGSTQIVLPDSPLLDPLLADQVDEAIAGDPLEDVPEAQPQRRLSTSRDFAGVYIRGRSGLESRARRFLSDQRDIDEVVQETFLRLFLAMPEIETEGQALAFCRRVVTNLCIDRYRADKRRPRLFELDPVLAAALEGDEFADHPVMQAEDAAVVRRALSLLTPQYRAALVKREIEEKPLPQIAAELGVPEESVKHLLFRARRALRRLLVGTAVDPSVDLSIGDIASLANRRAARGLVNSGQFVIIALVFVVVGVLLVRTPATTQLHPSVSSDVGGGLPGRVTPVLPTSPSHAGGGHGSSSAASGHGHHQAPSTSSTQSPSGTTPAGQGSGQPSTPPSTQTGGQGGQGGQHSGGHGWGYPTPGTRHGHQPSGGKNPPPSGPPPAPPSPYVVTIGSQQQTATLNSTETQHATPSGTPQTTSSLRTAEAANTVQQEINWSNDSGMGVSSADADLMLPASIGDGSSQPDSGQPVDFRLSDPTAWTGQLSNGDIQVQLNGTATSQDPQESSSDAVSVQLIAVYDSTLDTLERESVIVNPQDGSGSTNGSTQTDTNSDDTQSVASWSSPDSVSAGRDDRG